MRRADQVLTPDQMRAAEQALIDRGVSVSELMLRAGRGAADWIWRIAMGRSVTVLCGPGNNGGDGYVIAETLRERGLPVRVIAPLPSATDAARGARADWQGEVASQLDGGRGGVFVDCLFGSGLSRRLDPAHEALLAALTAAHDQTVAADLPSGVASDDGALLGAVPQCDVTLALGAWKPAHFLMPGMARMGTVRLVEIGIEPVADGARVFERPRLNPPGPDAHKYTRGLLGVIAGEMPGAALLAAGGAARSGAGYVKLLADKPIAAPPSQVVDTRPLGEALSDPRWRALLIGPGLGRGEEARERLGAALERGVPMVADADALHLLDDDLLEGIDPSRILVTPHGGELAALCRTFGIADGGKRARAEALAETTGLTVLAKGPDTLLAAPGRCALFAAAPSWLSTAGTGDVLAGVAASRMASGLSAFEAAGEAVWLHAEAAHAAGPALTTDDLVSEVSTAYARLL